VEIEESEDSIKAKIKEEPVDSEQTGVFKEFLDWFKSGMESLAKQVGKAFEMVITGDAMMSITSAYANVSADILKAANTSKSSKLDSVFREPEMFFRKPLPREVNLSRMR
jgi:hypothetical protein